MKNTLYVFQADFIALEIENKYPFINIDTGNGPEKITSTKIVSDDVWYQAIIDRYEQIILNFKWNKYFSLFSLNILGSETVLILL